MGTNETHIHNNLHAYTDTQRTTHNDTNNKYIHKYIIREHAIRTTHRRTNNNSIHIIKNK